MPKYEWKVEAVTKGASLGSFASNLETKLNELEKNGFEVQKMEIKDQGVLLTGRKPAKRTV